MSKLQYSEILKRKVRGGSINELTVPNWTLIREAIDAGKAQEANELVDYTRGRCEEAYVRFGVMIDQLLTYIAQNVGEEAIEKIWRARYASRIADFLRTAGTAEQFIKRMNEAEIGHHSQISITEEPDRYVLKADPCGSGGLIRRTVTAGTFKKAYPWTWSKTGVPYYCSHCALELEIMPIEARGYPLGIIEMAEKPEAPCVRLYYRRPELIPEKYFTRVGMKKDPSKFK